MLVKRGEFNLPLKARNLEEELSSMKITPEEEARLFIAKSRFQQGFLAKLFKPQTTYIDLLEEGPVLYKMGYRKAGIKRIIKALDINEERAKNILLIDKSSRP